MAWLRRSEAPKEPRVQWDVSMIVPLAAAARQIWARKENLIYIDAI
jgi:hypothetical protein